MARVAYTLPFGSSPMLDGEGEIAFAPAADGTLVSEEIAEARAARLCTIPGFARAPGTTAPAAAPRGAEAAAPEAPKPTRRKGSAAPA